MKRYIRSSSSLTELEEMVIDEFGSSNPGPGCSFIASDGRYINIYPKLDTHEDLCYWVEDQLNGSIDAPDEEYFIRNFNWIRLRTPPELMIVEMPTSAPVSKQWWALEDWLMYCEEKYPGGHELNLIICRDTYPIQEQIDFFGKDVFAEDVISLLKRYYTTHRLG